MKAQCLLVKNIGIIHDTQIQFNKPLLVLYGEIQQGKTTYLNAIRWVFGGAFPTDIIRKGETEASITLFLDGGTIHRSFYVARDGSTKSRPVIFERDGAPVRDAVAEIKKLLNPFLLNQDYLKEMTELERKKYFVSQFGANTSDLDTQIASAEALAAATRSELKGYGDIDTKPVEPPADLEALKKVRQGKLDEHDRNISSVRGELAILREGYAATVRKIGMANSTVTQNNSQVSEAQAKLRRFQENEIEYERQLAVARDGVESYQMWLNEHPRLEFTLVPPAPDLSVLEKALALQANTTTEDTAISMVEAQRVRYEQHQKNLTRQKERDAKEDVIRELERATRELRNKRIARLKECSEASGIEGLSFDEAGNFSYEGCQAGMLSTSQLMTLSNKLSSLYPAGFGIDLIDRAESLGKSIFGFVERAKRENKTILATVVGERPAEVPAEVGVFVVEQGRIK